MYIRNQLRNKFCTYTRSYLYNSQPSNNTAFCHFQQKMTTSARSFDLINSYAPIYIRGLYSYNRITQYMSYSSWFEEIGLVFV